jgi:hypothetical protein
MAAPSPPSPIVYLHPFQAANETSQMMDNVRSSRKEISHSSLAFHPPTISSQSQNNIPSTPCSGIYHGALNELDMSFHRFRAQPSVDLSQETRRLAPSRRHLSWQTFFRYTLRDPVDDPSFSTSPFVELLTLTPHMYLHESSRNQGVSRQFRSSQSLFRRRFLRSAGNLPSCLRTLNILIAGVGE